jgi:hypothetical protein
MYKILSCVVVRIRPHFEIISIVVETKNDHAFTLGCLDSFTVHETDDVDKSVNTLTVEKFVFQRLKISAFKDYFTISVLPTMTKMLDNHIIATADIIRQKLLVELVDRGRGISGDDEFIEIVAIIFD